MNPKNIELINIFVLLFIVTDYYMKYKKKMDSNSYLWLSECIAISLISIINIAIFNYGNSPYQNILVLFGYIIAIIPMLLYCTYINNNFILKKKNKREKLFIFLYFLFYSFIILLEFIEDPTFGSRLSALNEFKNYNIVILLISVPNLYLIGKCVFRDIPVGKRTYFALILPVVGVLFDYILADILFLTFSYTLTALLLYMYKYDSTINRDTLTGAKNRWFLENYIFSKRKMYALFMIDVDKFKMINDVYGHDQGDIVLKDITDILKESIRITDNVIRVGGDEFSIIAIIKKKEDIKVIIDRINDNINNYNKEHEVQVSVSIGYSTYSVQDNLDEVLKSIDEKMYIEKKLKNKDGKKKN